MSQLRASKASSIIAPVLYLEHLREQAESKQDEQHSIAPVDVDVQGSEGGDHHVQPQVEFPAADQQGLVDVAGDDVGLCFGVVLLALPPGKHLHTVIWICNLRVLKLLHYWH